jgi:serine/threonine-protein kinase
LEVPDEGPSLGPGGTEPGEPPSITTPGEPPLSNLSPSTSSRTPLSLSRPVTQLPGGAPPSVAWGSAPPAPGPPPASPNSIGSVPPPSGIDDDDKPTLIGDLVADRYRIQKELGSGGMGTVYRAEHVHMRKAVALKILHRELTYLPEVVARFEREAVAAARIEHPNIATAKDFGRLPNGSFYLVLEYIEGQSLRDVLDQGALRPEQALKIAREIASALEAAHAVGIVHRDLKPDNVMLTQKDRDQYQVKVLDFGIAKVELGDAQGLTQAGTVFGTPEYMAPEQAAGTPVDARADIYTLGIMLYEMLTGVTPFADDDMVVVLTRQMTLEPPPLPQAVDPAIAGLVMHLIAKSPDARPQTASEVIQRLDATLPMASSPYSSAEPWTPSPVSQMASSEARSVQYSDTVLSVAGPELERLAKARTQPKFTSGFLKQLTERVPALGKNVDIGGHPVPAWALAALAVLVLALITIIFTIVVVKQVTSGAAASSTPAASVTTSQTGVDLKKVASGDKEAMSQLNSTSESERNAAEWLALARGHKRAASYDKSMDAFKRAVALDSSLAKDREVASEVRQIALEPDHTSEALQLALGSLGATGADVVYDVWSSTRGKKETAEVNKIAKTHLDSAALRAKASPALAIALDLSKARSCGDVSKLLPRAQQNADARSMSKLKSLSARRGCGFLGLSDCYSCLRGGDGLSQAIKAAESRPAPSFQ